VELEKRRTPNLEIVVGTKVISWVKVNTDLFLQRFQVSRPTLALPGLDEKVESGVAETPP